MSFTKNQLVEYDRQVGKPPIIAVVIQAHANDTTTVDPQFVLGDDDEIVFQLPHRSHLRITNELLRPARKIKE